MMWCACLPGCFEGWGPPRAKYGKLFGPVRYGFEGLTSAEQPGGPFVTTQVDTQTSTERLFASRLIPGDDDSNLATSWGDALLNQVLAAIPSGGGLPVQSARYATIANVQSGFRSGPHYATPAERWRWRSQPQTK